MRQPLDFGSHSVDEDRDYPVGTDAADAVQQLGFVLLTDKYGGGTFIIADKHGRNVARRHDARQVIDWCRNRAAQGRGQEKA